MKAKRKEREKKRMKEEDIRNEGRKGDRSEGE